jgi:hypothetical protein
MSLAPDRYRTFKLLGIAGIDSTVFRNATDLYYKREFEPRNELYAITERYRSYGHPLPEPD